MKEIPVDVGHRWSCRRRRDSQLTVMSATAPVDRLPGQSAVRTGGRELKAAHHRRGTTSRITMKKKRLAAPTVLLFTGSGDTRSFCGVDAHLHPVTEGSAARPVDDSINYRTTNGDIVEHESRVYIITV